MAEGKAVKRIDIKEFREEGYLQELNRQFLHPLGLALEVRIAEDGTETLGGVWDDRDDPEGIYFMVEDEEALKGFAEKAEAISAFQAARMPARTRRLGHWIQPTDRQAP